VIKGLYDRFLQVGYSKVENRVGRFMDLISPRGVREANVFVINSS